MRFHKSFLSGVGVAFSLGLMACGGSTYDKEIEQSTAYLSAAKASGTDVSPIVENSTKARVLLAPNFDANQKIVSIDIPEESPELTEIKSSYVNLYSESILGSNGITFVGIFSAFLAQGSAVSAFQSFADSMPAAIDDSDKITAAVADIGIAKTVILTNTFTADVIIIDYTDEIPRSIDTYVIQSFADYSIISLLSRKFSFSPVGPTGGLSVEDADLFLATLNDTVAALIGGGLVSSSVIDVLNDSITSINTLAATMGNQQAVNTFLSTQFDG